MGLWLAQARASTACLIVLCFYFLARVNRSASQSGCKADGRQCKALLSPPLPAAKSTVAARAPLSKETAQARPITEAEYFVDCTAKRQYIEESQAVLTMLHIPTLLAFVRAVLPTQCAFCHTWPSASGMGKVCHACWARFQFTAAQCPRCALPLNPHANVCSGCLRSPSVLSQCLCAVPYAYPWHWAVQQFKFQGDTAWAATMAALLLARADVRHLLKQADALLPVALAPQRLQERGYNQASLIAQQLVQPHQWARAPAEAPPTSKPVWLEGLTRRDTRTHQVGLPRQQRLQALKNTFRIAPALQRQMQGKHIVLVDDVKTTGATFHALAHACLRAQAKQVSAIAFAFTPAD